MPITWFRGCFALGLTLCITVLICALMLEYRQGIMPCALCQLQRSAFLLIGLIFLIGLTKKRLTRTRLRYIAGINSFFICAGLYFVLRQLWLIHVPQAEPGVCGAGLSYIFQHLPLSDALTAAFLGTGDCATVSWRYLGISLPGWSGICLLITLILSWLPLATSRQKMRDLKPPVR